MTKAERFAVVMRAFEAGAFDDLIREFWDTGTSTVAAARQMEARILSMFGFFIWFGWLRSSCGIDDMIDEERTFWTFILNGPRAV
jgi:hypothetical protein